VRGLSAVRSRLFGLAVHDLNNPLAAMRILAEMLAMDLQDPQLQRDARDILEAIDQASLLTESLASLLRLERGHRELALQEVDLVGLVRQAVARVALRDYVDVVAPAVEVLVRADPEALLQALTDAAYNAKRLTEEGERVAIVVEAQPGPLVRMRSAGLSIADGHVPALLEPYGTVVPRERRVPVSVTGLAYARWVTERCGGRLDVRPLPDALEVVFAW
jgi:two-component system sensor histidine kinase QseC